MNIDDIADETQPAVGRQRLQPDVVFVFRKHRAEHHRPDAERPFHHHLEADAVAVETAEILAVVLLHELGAGAEEIATFGNCSAMTSAATISDDRRQ